jgi:hypothetical protein
MGKSVNVDNSYPDLIQVYASQQGRPDAEKRSISQRTDGQDDIQQQYADSSELERPRWKEPRSQQLERVVWYR